MKLQPVYRITVFVPPADLARLKQGILAVDDLAAGGYAEGMWESAADEQYRVLPGTRSVQGQGGERVHQPTVRLEFCIARDAQRLQRKPDKRFKRAAEIEDPRVLKKIVAALLIRRAVNRDFITHAPTQREQALNVVHMIMSEQKLLKFPWLPVIH